MQFGPFFYNKRKAKQDKIFILTLMLYCTSKSCKIQVAKVATKLYTKILVTKEKRLVVLATVLVAISSPAKIFFSLK